MSNGKAKQQLKIQKVWKVIKPTRLFHLFINL
jgi:hypothetical protein